MRKLLALMLCLCFAAAIPAAAQDMNKQDMNKKMSGDSLYKRLGGYDAIAAVSDDFLGRLAADPQFQPFFRGLSTDSNKRVRQHVVEFLCMATGGPCNYTGRDMKTAHAGLGISEADWNKSVTYLVATLEKFKVPEKEKAEVLAAVGGLKNDIVEKK
jgi:hemoglobin